jgi:abortive infection bacteriophage resistance protein
LESVAWRLPRHFVPRNDELIRGSLRYIGYYRLTGYCLPFQNGLKGDHTFNDKTYFDNVLTLYIFDRELRLLILDAIERIEVAFRAAISNTMSITYGSHWYLDKINFGNRYGNKGRKPYNHSILLAEINKADSISIRHYRNTYSNPKYPPSWMAIESLSFGTCSMMFAHLRKKQIRLVSNELDIKPTLLVSWIQGLVRLRNLCAHHSRVWNRKFSHSLSAYGDIPEELKDNLEPNNKFYAYTSVIMYFLKRISPDTKWAEKLVVLLNEHDKVRISDMAFPANWKERILWKDNL